MSDQRGTPGGDPAPPPLEISDAYGRESNAVIGADADYVEDRLKEPLKTA
jgi:hypothetical protein